LPNVRFVVDLDAVEDRVEGTVNWEGSASPSPFSSWLELLRLFEANLPAARRPRSLASPDAF
jgi:hypothetical protein